jgi:monoterpene epsilon-lactone hydrolase
MSSWKDPEIAGVRALLTPGPGGSDEPATSADARRAAMRAIMDGFGDMSSLPPGCRHEPITLGGIRAERVAPANAVEGRRILCLHGGGYEAGSPRSHRPLAARLAEAARSAAVLPDYRLAPEHPFPAALDDAVEAYRALLADGVWPERMIIAGDSAGGGLAVAVALRLKDEGLPQPAGLLLISPWADLTLSHATHETKAADDPMIARDRASESAASYRGGADARHPLISPVFGDFTGLAPMLIQVGSEETLLGDSLMLAERAGHARVAVRLEIWPEMIHVWHAFADQLAAARQAIRTAGAWMDEKLG